MHQHVDVLVDRARDEEAAVLAVVGGQVGSAAAERDPQRGPAEDDAHPSGRRRLRNGVRVRLEPVECADDRLLDRQRRLPAERADARAVEVDQGRVAGPAAPAAGVLDRRRDAEVRSDDRDGVVEDHRLVGTEVVDVGRPGSLALRSGRRQDRRRRSPARRGTTSPAGRRRGRAGASGRAAARGRSRRRARACSARRGSTRSGRSGP